MSGFFSLTFCMVPPQSSRMTPARFCTKKDVQTLFERPVKSHQVAAKPHSALCSLRWHYPNQVKGHAIPSHLSAANSSSPSLYSFLNSSYYVQALPNAQVLFYFTSFANSMTSASPYRSNNAVNALSSATLPSDPASTSWVLEV